MEPHVQRMHDELTELDAKLEKLTAFTNTEAFKELPEIQRDLLIAQSTAMATYCNILNMRIKAA